MQQNKYEGSEQLNFCMPVYCLVNKSCVCQHFEYFNGVGSFLIPEKVTYSCQAKATTQFQLCSNKMLESGSKNS